VLFEASIRPAATKGFNEAVLHGLPTP